MECEDTNALVTIAGDSARLYLHAFANYCDVAGRRYFTERVYEPVSFTRKDTTQTTSTPVRYLNSVIK